MTNNDAETVWIHCYPLNDVDGDPEATPCLVPVQRVEPLSFGVDSLIGRGDARWPDLPDTLSLTSPDSTPRDTTSAPDATPTPDTPVQSSFSISTSREQAVLEHRCGRGCLFAMTNNDAGTMLKHCGSLNDVNGDPEATPCPVPVQRVEAQFIDVKSSIGQSDMRCPDLPDTLSLTSPDSTPRDVTPTPAPPDATTPPRATTPRTSTPRDASPTPAPRITPRVQRATTPASNSQVQSDTDLLIDLDIQQQQEERAAQEMHDYAVRIGAKDKRATRMRIRHDLKLYGQVSSDDQVFSDDEVFSDDVVSNDDDRPQLLPCVQHSQRLAKRRSNREQQHEYPVKRGGDSSDAHVTIKYPGSDTEFTVRRFGIPEMDARHGNVLKFRRAWLLDYHAELRGYQGEGRRWTNIRLYCADRIYRGRLADVYEELYYVDLYFRNKFYSGFGKKQPAIELQQHYQAWCTFVNAYIKANTKEANAYEKSLRDREQRFYSTSVAGVAMKIHELSTQMRMSCTVPGDVECPSCYSVSGRAANGVHIPSGLAVLHDRLQDILKQRRTTTPAPIEHEVVSRLEDEVAKLRADVKLQQHQINNLSNELKERAVDCEVLQERNESLQRNIAAEVAAQLSQHLRRMASSVLSNNSSC